MVFGRKAIDIFLPYRESHISENDDIHKIAIDKLESEKLKKIFRTLVIEYPGRLSEVELRYLSSLTSRAERFYSLGIEKSEYEKLKSLKLNKLTLLLDTNILYSILNLSTNPEKAAVFELLKLSREETIDLKFVYLPKTYSELQQARAHLEVAVSRENFRPGQIRALLCSDSLDPFARQYFENKLINSETPHPNEILRYASDVLKSKGIIIYNERFEELAENTDFLNSKIAEYIDFQRYFNNLNEERGYDLRVNKSDKKIEHDIFLREAVNILKSKFGIEDELNFICLTMDNSIVHFDHYTRRKQNVGLYKPINPNFILPSTLLKRLRPFIPIISQDYRKAFITSLTAPSFESIQSSDSILIQQSMTYFKSLGIEDEEVIMNCIKRELFLKDFEKELDNGNAEAYIKSELAKELDHIKEKMTALEEELKQKDQDAITILQSTDHEKAKLQKESEDEKQRILKIKDNEVEVLNNDLKDRDTFIDGLAKRIESLEEKNQSIAGRAEFEIVKNAWLIERDEFIDKEWQKELSKLKQSSRYFLKILAITFIPVFLAVVIKIFGESLVSYLEAKGINQWYLWSSLVVIQLFEIFGRTYLFDKEKVKSGKKWLFSSNSKKDEDIVSNKKQQLKIEFEKNNKQPELGNYLNKNSTSKELEVIV